MAEASLELRPELSYERHLDRLIQIYEQRISEFGKLRRKHEQPPVRGKS
jgi:hypothetical protein